MADLEEAHLMSQQACILIIADEAHPLQATAHFLNVSGYEVVAARTGEEGLRLARQCRPDLVILALELPDLSGAEVCRRLKADPTLATCSILMFSAIQIPSDGLADGVDDYLVLPVSGWELLARIRIALRLKQTEDELQQHREHLEDLITQRTTALRQANQQLQQEISDRKHFEDEQALNELRLRALLELNQKSGLSLNEIADFILEQSITLTQSRIGFLGFLNEDESVCTIHTWSELTMQACQVTDRFLDFPIAESGLWGECVRQRRPFTLNEYAHPHPLKRGLPDGHVTLTRLLSIPVFEGDQIVAVAAVGNKKRPYNKADIHQLQLLGDGMVRVLQRNRIQDELRQAKDAADTARMAAEEANRQLLAQHQRIHEQNQELQDLISKKDKFFSIVAHDLKNPLSAFQSFVNLFSKDLGRWQPEEIQNLIGALRENVENLTALLDNLLTWARLEQGRLNIYPHTFDLQMLAVRNIELFTPMARQKAITLLNSIPPHTNVYADLNTVDTVMRNLVSNAVKFTAAAGHVTLTAAQKDDVVIVSVTDTGAGMGPEAVEALFRIDKQHQKAGTAGEKGTGLGLILCKEFIEKNGGRLRVESVEGEGSTFSFSLPGSA